MIGVAKILPHPQAAAGDLDPGQSGTCLVPGDFVYPGGKFAAILLLGGVGIQNIQQPVHPLQLQRRAEAAGEELPGGNQLPQVPGGHGAAFQVAFQKGLVTHGRRLGNFLRVGVKIHAAGAQLLL